MPTIESIAPSFFVTDLGRAVDWYVRVLGFTVDWQASDHAGVKLGPARIVLAKVAALPAGSQRGACHLHLGDGIDDYVARVEAAGQALTAPLADRPEYGMREASVRDPDGNVIYVGQPL